MPSHGNNGVDRVGRRRFLATLGASATLYGTGISAGAGSITTRDVTITSFDGTELGATVYEPAQSGPHPAILMTHGYGANRTISPFIGTRARTYATNGYVVLAYDSRGFGDSGGTVGINGPNEVRDAQRLLTYLAQLDSVATDGPDNPRVGMDGTSYGGGIQLNTAIAEATGRGLPESNDRIDALVPRWAWNDLQYSLAPNGVIKRGWALLLAVGGAAGSHLTGDDAFDFLQGQAPELYELLYHGLTENELPEWGKRFLTERSPGAAVSAITAPTLLIHGWPDTLFTPLEALWNADGDSTHRLLLTNGGHSLSAIDPVTLEYQSFVDETALDWFETHLKGDGSTALAPVTYYDSQADTFESADGLAPSTARWEPWTADSVTEDERSFAWNTLLFESEIGSVSFDWVVERELELLGPAELTLTVEPFGPETRLFASLSHVHDGTVTHIDDQVTPVLVEGDGVQERTVTIPPFHRSFAPGDRFRLQISTTAFGYQPSRTSLGVRLYHDGDRSTALRLPILE